jgi:hypothetical protein
VCWRDHKNRQTVCGWNVTEIESHIGKHNLWWYFLENFIHIHFLLRILAVHGFPQVLTNIEVAHPSYHVCLIVDADSLLGAAETR